MLTIFCSRLEQEAGQLLITVAIFLFHFTRFYGQRSLRACPLSLYKTFFQFSYGNYTHVHLHTRCSELSLLGCTCRASIVFWCQIVLNMLHGCPWASRTLQWFSQWCVCGGGGARTDVFNFTVHGRAQMTKVMSYSSRTCLCMTRCLYTVAFVVRSLAKYM